MISLNILTQLEILPEKLLQRKSKVAAEELTYFKRRIQEKHIRFLKKYPSVLISDIVEIILNADGTQTERNTLLADLPPGRLKDDWIWDFDLMHADYNTKKYQFKVIAEVL